MDWYLCCKTQTHQNQDQKNNNEKKLISVKNLAFIELNKTEAYEVTWLKLHYDLEYWKNNYTLSPPLPHDMNLIKISSGQYYNNQTSGECFL